MKVWDSSLWIQVYNTIYDLIIYYICGLYKQTDSVPLLCLQVILFHCFSLFVEYVFQMAFNITFFMTNEMSLIKSFSLIYVPMLTLEYFILE